MIRLRRLTPTFCAFHLGFSLGALSDPLGEQDEFLLWVCGHARCDDVVHVGDVTVFEVLGVVEVEDGGVSLA